MKAMLLFSVFLIGYLLFMWMAEQQYDARQQEFEKISLTSCEPTVLTSLEECENLRPQKKFDDLVDRHVPPIETITNT